MLTVCGCSEEGSTSLICDKTDGQCPCKPNVINRKCDECDFGYKSFPDCIRKFENLIVISIYLILWDSVISLQL